MYNTITHPTWLSVVFENRNQLYGAFQLRKEYEKNLIGGLLLSHASVAGLFGLVWLGYALAPKDVKKTIDEIPYVVTEYVIDPDFKQEIVKPPVQKPIEQIKTTQYQSLVVVPDDQKITTTVATQDDLQNTVISSVTTEGDVSTTENTLVAVTKVVEAEVPPEFVLAAEVMPSFPDQYGSISSYLSKLIRYPSEAVANTISGKVIVEFVINEKGELINPKIIRGLGYGCDDEVLRILALMPKWNPGKMNGNGVKVKMTMPVSFKLAD